MQLTEEEVNRAFASFSAFDHGQSGVRLADLKGVLAHMGCAVAEADVFEMCLEAECEEAAGGGGGLVPLREFMRLLAKRKEKLLHPVSEEDLAMAFSACGGDPTDEESFVSRDILVGLIKDSFGLSIDIEKMIEEIDEDGSGQIEFGEFVQLLTAASME